MPFRLSSNIPEVPDTKERGSTGMSYGYAGRLVHLEYVSDLTGVRGMRIFDRMRLSDPKVSGIRNALDLPILNANWYVEPSDPDNPRSVEIAKFVSSVLLDEMDIDWQTFLHECLLYLDYGHSVFEKVWCYNDGFVKLKHLGWLPPSTIMDINVQRRQVHSIIQQTPDKGTQEIYGQKLVFFVNQKEGDNFRGWSILRPMYKPWYNKERAEILLLILAERMGGWLKFSEPAGASTDDKAAADIIGQNFRINEQIFMRLPFGWDATLESAPSSMLEDLQAYINYCDLSMSNTAIAQVLDLGNSMTGSRALGRTLGDMFSDSIRSRVNYIEATFNDKNGIIAELCSYNFPDWKGNVPKLKAGKIEKLDLKVMAAALKTLGDAGMPFSEKTWDWVRAEAELPIDDGGESEKKDDEAEETSTLPYSPPDDWDAMNRADGDRIEEYDPSPGEIDEQPY